MSRAALKIVFLILAFTFSSSALAVTISGPSVSETGNYQISFGSNNQDHIQIERWGNGESLQYIREFSYAGTSGTHYESNIQPGTYYYRIRACDYLSGGGVGYCSYSNTKAVNTVQVNNPPVISPSTLPDQVKPLNTPAVVSFTVTDDNTAPQHISLFENYGGGSFSSPLNFEFGGSGSSRTLTITPATGDYGERTIRIRAQDQQGNGSSKMFSFKVVQPPGQPSLNSYSTSHTSSSINIGFGAASNPVTGYDFDKRVNGGSWQPEYNGGWKSSDTVNNLTVGNWQFRIRAYHTESSATSYSNFHYSSTVAVRPAVPTGLAVSDHTISHDGILRLTWSNPSLGNYTQISGTNNAGSTVNQNVSGSSWTSSALTEGNWQFRVRRCDDATNYCGNWTSYKSIQVYRRPNKANVSGFSESSPSMDGEFSVRWSSQSWADKYVITQTGPRNSTYTLNTTAGGVISFPVSLENNGSYSFVVDACNGSICAGNGSSKTMVVNLPAESQPGFDYDLNSTSFLPDESIGEFVAITQGQIGINNGMASYLVSIDSPPGINGLKPEFSFAYSSSSNFSGGIMGAGWNLAGLSSITRCVRDRIQQQFIKYTDSDRLCLDGEYLFRTDWAGYDTSGSFDGNKVFRTEIDSFTRIESNSNTTQFVVKHKNGNILTYGSSTNANNSLVYLGLDSSNPIKEWKLRKVEDRYGNAYELFYAQSTTTGDHYLSHVYYEPGASIVFNYETRDRDIHWGYDHGEKYQNTKILKSVTTYIDVPSSGSPTSGTEVKTYDLDYDSTDKYRIKELAECGFDDYGTKQCAQPLVFDWQDGEFGFESGGQQLVSCLNSEPLAVVQMVDFDNDGYNDILGKDFVALRNKGYNCYYDYSWLQFPGGANEWENPQPFRRSPPYAYYAVIGTDSDGKQRSFLMNFTNQTAVATAGSEMDGFAFVTDPENDGIPSVTTVKNLIGTYDNDYSNSDLLEPTWLDLDGDNLKELLVTSMEVSGGSPYATQMHYFENSSNTLYKRVVEGQFAEIKQCEVEHGSNCGAIVNGEVKSLSYCSANPQNCKENVLQTSDAFVYSPSPYSFGPQMLRGGLYRTMADLNGDGIEDIVYRKWLSDVDDDYWFIRIMRQDGTLGEEYNTGRHAITSGAQYSYVYDIDKDGDQEIILCNGMVISGSHSGVTNLNASGAEPQFVDGGGDDLNIPYGCPPTAQEGYGSPIRGDFNNDGLPDRFNSLGTLAYPAKPEQPNLMTRVTDGFGRVVELEYSTLDTEIYTPTTSTIEYPTMHATRNMQVVKKLKVDAGTSTSSERNITSYKYKGAKFDMYDHGFLGFEKVTAKDETKNTETTTNFLQEFPFIGNVSSTSLKDSNTGKTLETANFIYEQGVSAQNGTYVWLSESEKITRNLNGTQFQIAEEYVDDIDDYGNVLSKTSIIKDRYNNELSETVVTTSYSNDAASWLIGFPSSVTSSTTVTDNGQTSTHAVTNTFTKEPGTLDVKVLKKFVGTAKETTTTITRNSEGIATSTVNTAKDYDGSALPSRTQSMSSFLVDMYPQTVTNALNQSTSLTYDRRFGAVESSTDPNGLVSTTSFDALGRAITTSDALGNQKKVRSFYCSSSPALIDCPSAAVYGTATFVVNASVSNAHAAPVTVEYYDRLQRLMRSEVFNWNGDIVKVDTEFYSDGNLHRRSEPFTGYSPNYWTSYEDYDVLNRPAEISKPDGGAIEYSYDTLDGSNIVTTETATISSPVGTEIRTKSTYTNALGQVDSVEDTDSNTVAYTYNAQGSLVQSIVNNNTDTIISINYDIAGNKTSMADPDAKNIAWQYDGFGQLRKQIWQHTFGTEKSIEYQYDKLGRKISRQDVGGSTPASYSWTWDTRKKGLLSTASGNGFTENYYYNAASQINQTTTSLSGLSSKSFTFTYDSFGRLESKTYPSGLSIRNDYHAAGALARTRNDGTDEVLWAMGEASDTRGTLTQQIYGNSVITERQYDPTNGLIASILTGNAQINSSALNLVGNIQNLSYSFDSIGNLYSRKSQRTNASGTALENLEEVFSYDSQNRLTGQAMFSSGLQQYSRTFHYDALGNLTSRSDMNNISYNQSNGAGVHAITTAGDTTYHYDAYGNLSKRVSTSNGTEQLAWDAFNKPTQIDNTHFYYGPNHQRYKQVSGNTTTYYLAGGQYEVIVKNGTTTEKSYVGSYLVESKTGSNIDMTYLHRDHLGSVEAMTDENGAFIARMGFDAWGNRREAAWGEAAPTSTNFVTTRGYTGHEMLDSHKLIHMNGRVYDPVIGRFLSPDLFIQSPYNTQSFNRYSYVFNNPLSMVDPSGYLGADEIMYATMAGRDSSAMWSMTMNSVQSGINRSESAKQAKEIVADVRDDLGVESDTDITIRVNMTTGEAEANTPCSATNLIYGNGLGSRPTTSVNMLNSGGYFRYELKLDFALLIDLGHFGNPFGHSAFAVEGEGVYSYGTIHKFGSSTINYMMDRMEKGVLEVYVYEDIPREIVYKMISAFELASKQDYDFTSNNCATVCFRAMEAGDYGFPFSLLENVNTPASLRNAARSTADVVYRLSNSNQHIPERFNDFD